MTEQEWLESGDLDALLEWLDERCESVGYPGRKARLFNCGCCRQIWEHFADERCRQAVEVAERFADGAADERALKIAHSKQKSALAKAWPGSDIMPSYEYDEGTASQWAACAAQGASFYNPPASVDARMAVNQAESVAGYTARALSVTKDALCPLFRDVFGNAFRSATLDASWRTTRIVALTQAMYDEGQFDRMGILADALEEAGCTDAEVLAHCRGPGPHVRGCWVVDLLLGKE
jgi:hypothetical protein